MNTGSCRLLSVMFGITLAATSHAATQFTSSTERGTAQPDSAPASESSGVSQAVPLVNWRVDGSAGAAKINAARITPKAVTDPITIFRPVPPCRLVDTRGNGAPIQGGAFAPNTRRTMATAGNCGIPTGGVAGISLTLVTFNLTPSTGGFISVLAPAAPITGTNDIFNFGSQWSGTSVNAATNGGGSFDVYVAQATAHVIVDVNGYYQDMNTIDSNVEIDFTGTTTGDLFEVSNSGSGSAIAAGNYGGGSAIRIYSGAFEVSGVGLNSTFGPAMVHQVTTGDFGAGGTLCPGFPAYSVIDHPLTNGNPGALILVTGRSGVAGGVGVSPGPFEVYYTTGGCGGTVGSRWTIRDRSNTAHVNDSRFNVFIITP